jgi:hypothetical protein
MKEYKCIECNKIFTQKCNWIQHIKYKKYPCVQKINNTEIKVNNQTNNQINNEFYNGSNNDSNNGSKNNSKKNKNCINSNGSKIQINLIKKNIFCKYCCKEFLYNKNLYKHIREERCEVLKLQKQQKENIFVNLVKEDELNKTTDNKLTTISNIELNTEKLDKNQITILLNEIKNMFEIKLSEQKNQLEKEFENKLKIKLDEEKIQIESIKFLELEKNNIEL